MGEYAELQLRKDFLRGIPASKHSGEKSPIGGYCPHCGKGIRTIAGQIDESMSAHIKAKHKSEWTKLARKGGDA